MSDPTTIYVTRYAVTGKIVKAWAQIDADGRALRYSPETWPWNGWDIFSPSDYALTPQEAVAKVEAARITKIASLEKQIAKLKAKKIEAPE